MKKRELVIFLLCFAGAFILNVIGIIKHDAPARELVTQLHMVLLIALILYSAVAILRVLYFLVSRFWVRKK